MERIEEKEIKRIVHLNSEEDTEKFGEEIAEELKGGGTLALIGNLGAGKTTLTKYIAKGLGISKMITSPTFTIVNEYHQEKDSCQDGKEPCQDGKERIDLYHVDAYRLEGAEAAFDIGLEEYFEEGNICIIEWADIVDEILPDDTKYIFLEYGDSEGERIAKCTF